MTPIWLHFGSPLHESSVCVPQKKTKKKQKKPNIKTGSKYNIVETGMHTKVEVYCHMRSEGSLRMCGS